MPDPVQSVRHFNRFYTRRIGILSDGLYKSPFSLAEIRVLYELAHGENLTATQLGRDLGLDAGYLSRMLRGFENNKLIGRAPSPIDARQNILRLTRKGREVFAPIERHSANEVRSMLNRLSPGDQTRLIEAMQNIEELLGGQPPRPESFIIRDPQPGDMGWVVRQHGLIYAREYGWNQEFEAFVADLVSRFVLNFDATREHCWIAERQREIAGAVFLTAKTARVAQLRMLIVDPSARGLGIGHRLVEECVRFARQAGYAKITLWTNDVLTAARHLYEQAGFRLIKEEPHHSFGHDLIGQTWHLKLYNKGSHNDTGQSKRRAE